MPAERPVSALSENGPILNEPQRRHFEVFLSMLETALAEVETLAGHSASAPEESLIVYDSDLPNGFSTRAEPVIRAIRHEITSLAHALNIEAQHRSRARVVKALLTAEMVRLDDSYARKLRGYGTVSPRVGVEIDPILDRMRSKLVDLLRMSERNPPNRTPSSLE